MIQHFFTSDDVPNVTAPHSWVEEDASWWVGIQKCGAQLALAVALTLASSTAALATQVFSYHQDDPQLTASYEDEQTWINQVAPFVAPTNVPATWSFDEQTPALTAAYEDEQTWQNQVAPYVAPTIVPDQWCFAEDFPTLTAGYLDEQTWVNPVAPVQWSYIYPTIDQDEIPAAFLSAAYEDEQTWWNQVSPIPYWVPPQLFLDDQIIVPQPQQGIPDDNEIWQNQVQPFVAPNQLPVSWAFDEQTAGFYGILDEDSRWVNQVPPLVSPNILPYPWQWDEQTPLLFGVPDDNEIWQLLVAPVGSYPVPQVFVPDEIVLPPFTPAPPEEDFWWNQVAPYVAPTQVPYSWNFDEQTPTLVAPTSICSSIVVPDFMHQMPDTMVMDICRNSGRSDNIRQAAACELISRLNTRTDLLTWKNYFLQGLIQTPVPLQFLIDFFEIDDTTQDKQLDGRFVQFIDAAGE